MSNRTILNYLFMFNRVSVFLFFSVFTLACQGETESEDQRLLGSEKVWEEHIKPAYFSGQTVVLDEQHEIIQLKAPYKAEDPATVPISIHLNSANTEGNHIKKIYIFVDKNPSPVTGIFDFTKPGRKADLAMRIRVNEFSYVRAIAETVDGKFYMTKSFVKAAGGCSAPPPAGPAKFTGKMKTRIMGKVKLSEPNLVQLKIKHPNFSGMEAAAPGQEKPKAHFIKNVSASLNGESILNADLTFSISTDPSFRFYITPKEYGVLQIVATDTKGDVFTHSHNVDEHNVSVH